MIENVLTAMVGLAPPTRPMIGSDGAPIDPAARYQVRCDGAAVASFADEDAAGAAWERIMLDDAPGSLDIVDRVTGGRLRAHPGF